MHRTTAAGLVTLALAASAARGDGDPDPLTRLSGARTDFSRLDEDGDGFLSRNEFPCADLYGTADGDADEKVSEKELRDACLALARKAMAGPDVPAAAPPAPGAKRHGKPARLTPADVERLTAGDPRFHPDARAKEVLALLDRDPADGRIQRSEHAGEEAADDFHRHDADRDGDIEGTELLSWMRRQIEGLEKLRKNPPRKEFVYLFDLDRDNVVTRPEFDALDGRPVFFRTYDADGDGIVKFEETRYEVRKTGNRYSPEVVIIPPQEPKGDTEPVNRNPWSLMDKDGDARVDLVEFGGNEPVFRRLDRNHDGFLTIHDA